MTSLLSLINKHKMAGTGFAIYRWPNESNLQYQAGNHSNDSQEVGFPFSAFSPESKDSIFLKKDESITSNSLDELLAALDIGFSQDQCLGDSYENSTSKEEYQKGFEIIQSDISNGVIQKAILSRKKNIAFEIDKLDKLFEQTLINHPAAMVYCFFHPTSGLWIGASPELILRQQGTKFKTASLAGTKNTKDGQWGKKEIEEQKIVTDFITSNLNEINSTYTLGKLETIKAGKIYHLKQLIEFELSQGKLLELMKKLHPTPAIGGHPKQAAYSTIKKAENHSREYYCGYLGEVNKENSRLYINLRCIKVYNNQIQIFVGGGITKQSILEDEWNECERKAEGFLSLL